MSTFSSVNFGQQQTPQVPQPIQQAHVNVPVITIDSKDGSKYEIFTKEQRAFVISTNRLYSNMFFGLFIALIVAIGYDYIKDLMRTFSGYRDILGGRSGDGLAKMYGLTSGNMQRFGVIVVLLIALYLVYPHVTTRMEISLKELPSDVATKYMQELSKYSSKS